MFDSSALELTHETLDAFRVALRRAGAPIADQFEPGITDEEINSIGSELGVEIPSELRTLWTWAVAPTDSGVDNSNWTVNYAHDLWPPRHAATETERYLAVPRPSKGVIAFAGPTGDG